ncbi:MAG TPA: hypothetical protein PKL60_02010 [Anaerolineaceae bacterium]|nr:hypothetical protein [Anaerolineaceae bacterium]
MNTKDKSRIPGWVYLTLVINLTVFIFLGKFIKGDFSSKVGPTITPSPQSFIDRLSFPVIPTIPPGFLETYTLNLQKTHVRVNFPSGCPNGCTEYKKGCDIKGNIAFETKEKIYHVPDQKYYDETIINADFGERWFCTEDEAIANGWRKSYE